MHANSEKVIQSTIVDALSTFTIIQRIFVLWIFSTFLVIFDFLWLQTETQGYLYAFAIQNPVYSRKFVHILCVYANARTRTYLHFSSFTNAHTNTHSISRLSLHNY